MPYTNIDSPKKYFETVLYTGTGASLNITGLNFKPDWVWTRFRSASNSHYIFDAVRGTNKVIFSDGTYTEATISDSLNSFNSDGFTLGTNVNVNQSGTTFASWNWLGANTTVSNTAGTITSTVSANTTSGFSIVSYTGNGTNGATIGHGLGVAPKMIIVKRRNGDPENWNVYHASLGNTKRILLNSTATEETNGVWFNTTPTSTLFYVSGIGSINENAGTYIAYCFADVKGYSKFGSYQGNSSTDGTFVYIGFKPAFVIIKNITNGNNWIMLDNKRGTYNLQSTTLYPNTSDVETSTTTNFGMDFLSNGMKMRTSGGYTTNSNNASGNTYIYMAFAENPFVSSKGIPTTAR